MARRGRQGVLKRQRERKKAEKAAFKREQRAERTEQRPETGGAQVASREDLAAYGLGPESEEDESDDRD